MTCPHDMPTPASCVDCMDEGPVAPPAKWEQVGRTFRSRFAGVCRGCRAVVHVDDLIQRWDRGAQDSTTYTHAGCRP